MLVNILSPDTLKGKSHENFSLYFFHESTPHGPRESSSKFVQIQFRIHGDNPIMPIQNMNFKITVHFKGTLF